jgi:hypothetical protein
MEGVGDERHRGFARSHTDCPGVYWGAGRRRLLAYSWEREDARSSAVRVRFQVRRHLRI